MDYWRNFHSPSHIWIALGIVAIGVLELSVVMLIRWLMR